MSVSFHKSKNLTKSQFNKITIRKVFFFFFIQKPTTIKLKKHKKKPSNAWLWLLIIHFLKIRISCYDQPPKQATQINKPTKKNPIKKKNRSKDNLIEALPLRRKSNVAHSCAPGEELRLQGLNDVYRGSCCCCHLSDVWPPTASDLASARLSLVSF